MGKKKKSWKHKGGGKTYDPGKEETKKARKKKKKKEERLHKENALLSVLSEDVRLNVAEILQSIELAPETRRSCKEEINCRGTQNAEKG